MPNKIRGSDGNHRIFDGIVDNVLRCCEPFIRIYKQLRESVDHDTPQASDLLTSELLTLAFDFGGAFRISRLG